MVLIFPVKSLPHPARPGKLRIPDAGIVQGGCTAIGVNPANVDPLYREEKGGKFKARGLSVPGGPAPIEDRLGDSDIWVHPSLPFVAADIPDGFSFGNGVTCSGIAPTAGPLAGQVVSCGWIVVDDMDGPGAKGKANQLMALFNTLA